LTHTKNSSQKLIRTKLSQILPRFVNKKDLENSGDLRYNESYDHVTIAFIYLSNFEEIFNELGQKTFYYLNQLFERLDTTSVKYGC